MDSPAPGRSKVLLAALCWSLAAMPALAVFVWTSFAAAWPEPTRDRFQLRESVADWRWDTLLVPTGSARHVVAEALQQAALEIPGATIASVAWVPAFAALLLALGLGTLLRRAFDLRSGAGYATVLVAGLLVASPGFGLVWLRSERLGLVLAPLLFVTALGWLARLERAPLRLVGVILLAGLAPFCHTHGLFVGVALLPALVAMAARAGSRRIAWWVGLCVVVAVAAGWYSIEPMAAGGVSAGSGLLAIAPIGDFVRDLCVHAGEAWLDLLPDSDLDAWALGAASWLVPLLLLFVGDRSQAARWRAAPWWSCVWFALAVVLWNVLRYDAEPPVGRWREALFGTFLLPVGLCGVLACRFGPGALRVGFGVAVVLAVQDWFAGLEDLRIARALVRQQEAVLALPGEWHPELAAAQDRLAVIAAAELRARARVPAAPGDPASLLAAAPPTPATTNVARGELRSSLRHPAASLLLAIGRGADGAPVVLGVHQPDWRRHGRSVPWQMEVGASSSAPFVGVLAIDVGPLRSVGLPLPSAEDR